MSSIKCAYSNCQNTWSAPFHDVLWIHIHASCEEQWWEESGPWPRPATITMRGGLVKVLGEATETAVPDDDDPELLRRRGVYT